MGAGAGESGRAVHGDGGNHEARRAVYRKRSRFARGAPSVSRTPDDVGRIAGFRALVSVCRGNDGSGVRTAEWERDRLGYISPFSAESPSVISAPLDVSAGEPVSVGANVSGTGPNADFRFSLLDERFLPIPGFGGADAGRVTEDGLDVPIRRAGGEQYTSSGDPLYLSVESSGARPEDLKLHAVYLG